MADKKISQLTAATTPLAGTEVLPIVQSGSTVKVSSDDLTVKNVRSNATTGILQVTGPAAATTRVMTVPNSDFTVATTGANTFSGIQDVAATFNGTQATFGYTSGRGLLIGTALNGGTNEGSSVLDARGAGAGQLVFKIDGTTRLTLENTGNLVVGTAGKGIDFSANTGAAGETSALLNWYEEGTWTTTLGVGVTVNSGSWAATATYTRIGRTVFWNVVQTSGDISASAGIEIFSGLPFAPARASSCTYTNSAASLAGVGLTETNSKVYVAVAITAQTALRFSGMYEV